jgi:hypothetical protein
MAGGEPGGGTRGVTRRSAAAHLRDLHADLAELTDGITVTEAAHEVEPVAPPPQRRRRSLGRLAPGVRNGAPTAAPVEAPEPPAEAPEEPVAVESPTPDTKPVRARKRSTARSPAPQADPGKPTAPETLAVPGKPAPRRRAPARGLAATEAEAPAAPRSWPARPAPDLFTPSRPAPPPVPELADDVEPGDRPWTVAAAMEPLPPLSPAELAARLGLLPEPSRRSRLMTAVVVLAAATAIFVLVASHLDLGHTQAPSFAVNELSALKDAADTSVTPTGHFLPTAPEIDLQISYVGAAQGDTLTLDVSYSGAAYAEHTYTLGAGNSTIGGPLTPQGSEFRPGAYMISALWHGTTVRTAQFTVDPPEPSPAAGPPTPGG